MTLRPRSLPLLALALAVAVLVVQARVIAGGKTWDDLGYHTDVAPSRLAAASAIARGNLPDWWDGTGFGVPLASEPSHGAAYPVIWLARSPHALDLVIVLHVLWAALGVAVWARRRSSEVGALVAGILVATTGLVTSAALRGALPALSHLPWIGMLACSLRDDRRPRAAIGIGVLVGAVGLAGQFGLLVDAVVLALVLGARRETLRWLLPALGAGLAIAAVQWLPAALSLGRTAGVDVHAMSLSRLIELVVPGSFGSNDPARAVTAVAGAHAWAPSLYVGAPILALATVQRPSRRLAIVMGVFAVLAFVVGRGGWPAWLGAPELHLAALVLVAAAHAGGGLDALVGGERRALFSLVAATIAAALGLAAVAVFRATRHDVSPAIDRAIIDGALGLGCMIAAAVLVWRAPKTWRPLVLALIVAPGVGATPSVSPAIGRSILDEEPAWARAAEPSPVPRRMFRPEVMFQLPNDLETAIASLAGTSAARWGIAAARSDDPARSRIDDRVWVASAQAGGELLRRFGIGLAVLPAVVFDAKQMRELGRRSNWVFVAFDTWSPASVIGSWEWTPDLDDALARLFPEGVTSGIARSRLVLSGTGTPNQEGSIQPVPCAIERWIDGAIDLSCTSTADAYAVVTSSSARGWSVAIDDHDVDWVTADAVRRAVAIPAGTHRVAWRFTTPGRRTALLLGAVGVLALLALWLASARRPAGSSSS
ncbi:MAG: hypothetical protein JWO36_446 [Myxococcales bacterium]|nr:hypothetical protein [Myxococcales bacterium]